MSVTRTFTVTVANPGAGNRYYIDGVLQETVNLIEGKTYRFDVSDSSVSGHPFKFSTTSNGTHNGGSEYTTGVTTSGTAGQTGAYVEIAVAASAPQLYYYCQYHSGMGGQANTVDSSVLRVLTVTVANPGAGNRYYIDGVLQETVNLAEGYTYRFDQSAGSNGGHPFKFSTTSNGTHSGGSEYTTGVTYNGTPGNPGAYTQIAVAASAPQLYYYCQYHSGMGGQANTVDSDTWGVLKWNENSWGSQDSVEFSITGLSATSSLGELVYAAADDGWGRDAWGDNSWGNNQTPVTLTGLSATSSLGELAYAAADDGWGRDAWGDNAWGENQITVPLTGLTATTSLPNVGWGDQVFGSDNEGWGGIYQLPVANVMGLTGLSADADLGTLTTTQLSVVSLTGLSLQSTVGLVETDDHSVGLTGLSAQTALGTATTTQLTIAALTGLDLDADLGTITISSNPVIALPALSAQTALGGVSVDSVVIGLTGLEAESDLGSLISVQATVANLNGLGLTATTTLNDAINLQYFNRKVPKDSTGYSRKVPKDSTGYTRKVAN